ncbi:ATP-grasp domain-containing protein [Clostridium perfringens]|nr:ATP-grasp domain-containing protein [Clostridium perfringens]MDM0695028.1 ATP-grasp domain-containing protein [Clostridium perfringens]
MKNITILLSAAGSPTIPGILKCFRNNGERNIRIIGIDMIDEPSVHFLVDKFYRVPAVADPDYCKIVLDICKKECVDIYFPNISAEVSALLEYKDQFESAGIRLAISNRESIDIANNKFKTYQMLRNNGVIVPAFYEVNSLLDFVEGCKELGYPEQAVCLKIVSGSGSRGVRIIDNSKSRYEIFANSKPNTFFTSYEDMISILDSSDNLKEMMLMPYLPGNEYTVDLLAENGRVLYKAGRENEVSLMSIAQESVLQEDKVAYEVAEKVVELLNYTGNMGLDFMRDSKGIPVLTDINPRITATVSVIAAGGINLPYLRIKQLLGEKLPDVSIEYGTRLKRRYGEIYTDKNGNRIII